MAVLAAGSDRLSLVGVGVGGPTLRVIAGFQFWKTGSAISVKARC
jgi:hypothetical protein